MTSRLRFPYLQSYLVGSLLDPSLRRFSKKAKDTAAQIEKTLGELKDVVSLDKAEEKMQKSIDHFKNEMAKIHTGRATSGMLDHIQVTTSNGMIPLKALGMITVKDVHRLGVSLFDLESKGSVFSAIEASPIQLTPKVVSDRELMVTLPRRSKDSIEALIKIISNEAEHCKSAIRSARKLGISEVKTLPGKDDQKRGEKAVTLLTESYIKEIDDLYHQKKRNLQD